MNILDQLPQVRLHPGFQSHFCISQGFHVLTFDKDGFIHNEPEMGYFVHQTRMLSQYHWLLEDEEPKPIGISNIDQQSWLGYYIHLPKSFERGKPDWGSGLMEPITEHTLEMKLARFIGSTLREEISLTNYSQMEYSLKLVLKIDADFADQKETDRERMQFGELARNWDKDEHGIYNLSYDYRAEHDYDHQGNKGTALLHRGVTIQFKNFDSEPDYHKKEIRFKVHLSPGDTWKGTVEAFPKIFEDEKQSKSKMVAFGHEKQELKEGIVLSEFETPGSDSLSPVVLASLKQAKKDLMSMRLQELDVGDDAWAVAAGLPIYVALFGRDSLTTGWQSALLGPEMMLGALRALARAQGQEVNDWRDEQPGRMLHEAHSGPLARLHFNPRERYYGSVTASAFYPFVVSELWHWTGNKELVKPMIEPALKAMQWRVDYGDLDGDGFFEYKTRSNQGVKNQSWKDSDDAIVYEDGRQVEPPIATCEEQAFVYGSMLHMSEVLWWMGDKDKAKQLYHQAGELKKHFNETFWMEDEAFFALGLDSENNQIRSIASNPGHCLAAGIVDEKRIQPVAERLMAKDLYSGWGVRTLSAEHPAFNPYSYHRGSVWPAEQATFVLGFMRYGLTDYMHNLAKAQFEAAALYDFYRLPEALSGHVRDAEHPFPAFYAKSNWPQAWSASATFLLLQSMLGLYPYAPLNILFVDPHLPEWLPDITIRKLRVGGAVADIHFYRKEDGKSSYRVLDIQGKLHVVHQPSLWSLRTSFVERAVDAFQSLLPGR